MPGPPGSGAGPPPVGFSPPPLAAPRFGAAPPGGAPPGAGYAHAAPQGDGVSWQGAAPVLDTFESVAVATPVRGQPVDTTMYPRPVGVEAETAGVAPPPAFEGNCDSRFMRLTVNGIPAQQVRRLALVLSSGRESLLRRLHDCKPFVLLLQIRGAIHSFAEKIVKKTAEINIPSTLNHSTPSGRGEARGLSGD